MKTVAKIFIALSCLAVLAVAGYILSSRLSLSGRLKTVPAMEAAEAFDTLKKQVVDGEYEGISALSKVEKYYFVTVRIDIKSYSPFRTEWINLRVESASDARIIDKDTRIRQGDVPVSLDRGDLLVSDKVAWLKEMEPFGKLEGDDAMYVTLLSASKEPELKAYVEYYIFGRYHSIEVPLRF